MSIPIHSNVESSMPLIHQLGYMLGDWTMVIIVISTLTDLLPPIAAILSIIWMTIRIFETRTVRGWIRRWKNRGCPDCS